MEAPLPRGIQRILEKQSWKEWFICQTLKQGPLPNHIGYIMDGNRRWSRENEVSLKQGYDKGRSAMDEIIRWFRMLGISEVSFYAFSIENFKRSQYQIDLVIDILRDITESYLQDNSLEVLSDYGVKFKFVGELQMFPEDVHKLMCKLMYETINNSKYTVNIVVAYTNSDDIVRAVEEAAIAVKNKKINIPDINPTLLDKLLLSKDLSPVDMIVRTSGEIRLSEYLQWKGRFAYLHFVNVNWPEFGMWESFKSIFYYQQKKMFSSNKNINTSVKLTGGQEKLIDEIAENRMMKIKNIAAEDK